MIIIIIIWLAYLPSLYLILLLLVSFSTLTALIGGSKLSENETSWFTTEAFVESSLGTL